MLQFDSAGAGDYSTQELQVSAGSPIVAACDQQMIQGGNSFDTSMHIKCKARAIHSLVGDGSHAIIPFYVHTASNLNSTPCPAACSKTFVYGNSENSNFLRQNGDILQEDMTVCHGWRCLWCYRHLARVRSVGSPRVLFFLNLVSMPAIELCDPISVLPLSAIGHLCDPATGGVRFDAGVRERDSIGNRMSYRGLGRSSLY